MGTSRFLVFLRVRFLEAFWFLMDLALVKTMNPTKEMVIPTMLWKDTGIWNNNPVQTMAKILRVQLRAAWWTTLILVSK